MFKGIIFAAVFTVFSVASACIETAKVKAQDSAETSCSFQDGKAGVATLASFVYLGIDETAPNKFVGKFGFFCSNNKAGVGEMDLSYAGDLVADDKNNAVDESKCTVGVISKDTAPGIKF